MQFHTFRLCLMLVRCRRHHQCFDRIFRLIPVSRFLCCHPNCLQPHSFGRLETSSKPMIQWAEGLMTRKSYRFHESLRWMWVMCLGWFQFCWSMASERLIYGPILDRSVRVSNHVAMDRYLTLWTAENQNRLSWVLLKKDKIQNPNQIYTIEKCKFKKTPHTLFLVRFKAVREIAR